ncbi:multiubiquitin domain-containing protein [Terrabacter sp. C0L_2]|uniref:multiubiquitin domain-containing protein n=1 Tax=Terrabacter sp. C0L_2 TaxID=3108389 RepID=UPI002ED325EB|nr:multiubiquitin domain-containing protein [Terrabacter sp. C0L_2]
MPEQTAPKGPNPKHGTVGVTFNTELRLELPKGDQTGLQIKQAAIAQQAPIELNFQLSVLHGQRYDVIGDEDIVKVHTHMEFTCVAPDDNS